MFPRRNMKHVILIILIVGLIIAFSAQNEVPVPVSFLIWKFETSLASVAVASVLTGVVMAQLLGGLSARRKTAEKRQIH